MIVMSGSLTAPAPIEQGKYRLIIDGLGETTLNVKCVTKTKKQIKTVYLQTGKVLELSLKKAKKHKKPERKSGFLLQ